MNRLLLRDELVSKIKLFNKIFELDFMNSDESSKNWKSYLDPISKYLYDQSFFSFINDNPLEKNVPPGALEAYYNIFSYIEKDLGSMITMSIPNEIYLAAMDVKRTFDDFICKNNFKINLIKDDSGSNQKVFYRIYPAI